MKQPEQQQVAKGLVFLSLWVAQTLKMEAENKATIVGEVVKHTSARSKATCEISARGFSREDVDVNILTPSKVPASYSLSETEGGLFFVEFVPQEVGTYIMDVYAAGQKIPESPVFYKVYDSSLIRVTEAGNGVVGQPCQFRVDASQAGEGQLEISINDGEVPNHVQVLGGGRCLVHFTPEVAKPHTIDIKFNGEPINGCPFICRIADTSKVSVALHHLELFPVNEKASFQIHVDTADNAELAVSVAGPRSDLPVQVTGNIKSGFLAEFLPEEVGPYVISVEYNNVPVGGTPFTGKLSQNFFLEDCILFNFILTYAVIMYAPLHTHLCFPLPIQARPMMPPKFSYPPFHGEQLERPLILLSMPARLEKATSKLPYRQEGETFQRKCTHRAQQSLWLALFLWKE